MKFKLHEIKIQNFLSIGEIPCHIELDKVHSTLITGDNGAGKTTIVEALTFALFNRTYRKIKKDDIINSFTGSNCLVYLKLSIGNNTYEVTRGIKPNIFEVIENGKKLDQLVGTNGQKRFESLLGLDFNVYRQLIVLGTSGYEEFMSLSTGDRRKLLEKILKLDVLSVMSDENKGIIKNINLKLDNINFKIDTLTTQNERSEEESKRIKDRIESIEKEIENINQSIEIDTAQLQLSEEGIKELNDKISSLPKPKPLELLEHQTLPLEERNKFKEVNDKLDQKEKIIKEEISKQKSTLIKLQQEVKTYQTVLDRYQEGGECPSCLQTLDTNNKQASIVKDLLEERESEISSIGGKLKELVESSLKQINDYRVKTESLYKVKVKEIEDINKDIDSQNEKIREEYYNSNNERNKLEESLSFQKFQKDSLQSSIENNKNHLRSLIKTLDDLKSTTFDNKSTKEEIDSLMKEKESLSLELYQRNVITNLLKDDGIRSDMINRYIPLFNQSVQKYLELLGADYIFTVDSSFNESILSRGRENFKYESFSRGEQARIDLAILFSWRDIIQKVSGTELSLLILDEVFDSSTDENGVESIKRVLKSMGDVNVFSISHKDHNPEDFDSVINVKKVGRFSTYERTFNLTND